MTKTRRFKYNALIQTEQKGEFDYSPDLEQTYPTPEAYLSVLLAQRGAKGILSLDIKELDTDGIWKELSSQIGFNVSEGSRVYVRNKCSYSIFSLVLQTVERFESGGKILDYEMSLIDPATGDDFYTELQESDFYPTLDEARKGAAAYLLEDLAGSFNFKDNAEVLGYLKEVGL